MRDGDRMQVLLLTEGTYPFHWGGLSTWCHSLIRELPEVDFSLIAVSDSPSATVHFELPENVVDFRALPLWGVRNAWELDRTLTMREVRRRARRTTDRAVEAEFVPELASFLAQLLGEERDDDRFARAIHRMYRFLQVHDFDRTFRSRPVWDALRSEAEARYPALAAAHRHADARPLTLEELTAAAQWIYHWFFALSQPLPRVDVAHATMGGICSLIALVAKREHGSGFLLSEHGIYLRECYLAEHAADGSLFGKLLKLGFARRMTEVAYAHADAVAPCCDYNHRWQRQIGVEPERIHTAYYGLDPEAFVPAPRPTNDVPVVAWAGRIDPLKDVETLLRAAAVVNEARPEIRFRLYGAAPAGNEAYLARCTALHGELGLEASVSFEGFASDTAAVYAEADLVVLSSISEGFPYSTLEAMLSGTPVVATAVGGLREQVSPECGRTVRPRDPQALGEAILDVLDDMDECALLARAARERAASLFSIERFRATHRRIYAETLRGAATPQAEIEAEDMLPALAPVAALVALEAG